MSITVKSLLENGPLKDAKLLAGKSGIYKEVIFVNIMEVPGVVNWMKGGELLLTSGYAFKDDVELRSKIVYELAKKGVAALGIKPGQFFHKVPNDIIRNADNVGLPLIEIPSYMPYSEIMRPIFEVLINDQYFKLKKAEEVHEQLFELLLKGGNLDSVAKLLSKLIANPVVVMDNSGNIRGVGTNDICQEADVVEIALDLFSRIPDESQSVQIYKRVKIQHNDTTLNCMVISVEINRQKAGYIIILEYSGQLDEQDMMALHHATTSIALEFSKERAVFETEKRLGSELLEDLIFGRHVDIESIRRRASFLKFKLNQKKTVFVIKLIAKESLAARDEFYIDSRKRQVFNYVYNQLTGYSEGVLVVSKSDRIVGIAGTENKELFHEKISSLFNNIKEKFRKEFNFAIGIGSEYEELKSLKNSYNEATFATDIEKYFDQKIIYYEKTLAYKLLFELKSSKILKTFYKQTLEILEQYDSKNGTELLKTLEVYFANDCNVRKTAEDLFIHKNSLLYRLRRIEKLTGFNLRDAEDKFNLQLALKIRLLVKE